MHETMTERQEQLLEAYFADQITDPQRVELINYLHTDKAFAKAFREYDRAYITACIPAFEKTKDFRRIEGAIQERSRSGRTFWKFIPAAACALALLLFGGALLLHFNTLGNASGMDGLTIVSQNGTGTEATLPDGTRVRINAQSSLTLAEGFGGKSREVKLDGEAFFEVAHDSRRPFRVHTGNACVSVKGTTFNVRSYGDEEEITVSLLEGAVVLNTPESEVALTPGLCGVVSRTGNGIELKPLTPMASAWIDGKYMFEDKSVPEILHNIERNYGVHFTYADSLFGDERFTGTISYNLSIDEVLNYIDVDGKYAWRRTDNTIEIYGK